MEASTSLRIFKGRIWDNYKYNVSVRRENLVYYVCNQTKIGTCRGRGVLKDDVFTLLREHSHQPITEKLKREEFKQHLYRALVKNQTEKFKKIYEYVRNDHPEASIDVPFSSIESAMFKWRQKIVPPPVRTLPSYVMRINSDAWKHLLKYTGGTMHVSLHVADDHSHIVLFLDPNFVRKISTGGTFYLDATFKVVPKNVDARQLLTILSRKYDHGIPCIWALMERKTASAYSSVFAAIKNVIPEFETHEAMTDFEAGLRSALLREFINILVHGCFFHYTQALFKNALRLGLKNILEQNEDARHLLDMMMSLALLPANLIISTFREIRNSASPFLKRVFAEFFQYYEREWILKTKPEVFSVYMLKNRTNNCLEAYHKTLKAKFGVHPPMWAFSKNLINVQQNFDLDLKSLQLVKRVRRLAKPATTRKQKLLLNAWSILAANGFTPIDFLKHVLNFQSNSFEAYIALYGDSL